MNIKLWGVLAVSLLLAACAGTAKPPPPPVGGTDYTESEYKIGVGDQLGVSVWRNTELSISVPVRPDGKISVPLVGDVMAAGLSAEQLAADLTKKLESYVRNPQVTVIVTNASSADFQQRVRVTGAVQGPRSIPYRKGMTVLDLILTAGGLNPFASGNKAKLYRITEEGTQVYPIYVDDILNKGKLDTNYPLLPSDIVTVPERAF